MNRILTTAIAVAMLGAMVAHAEKLSSQTIKISALSTNSTVSAVYPDHSFVGRIAKIRITSTNFADSTPDITIKTADGETVYADTDITANATSYPMVQNSDSSGSSISNEYVLPANDGKLQIEHSNADGTGYSATIEVLFIDERK